MQYIVMVLQCWNTVKTRHQETRLLKSGCPVSYDNTKEIKQAAQFLISSLRNYQLYILNFAESKKFIGGDDFETKSMTFKAK